MAFKKLPYKKAILFSRNGDLEVARNLVEEYSIEIYSVEDIEDEDYKKVRKNIGLTLEFRKFLSKNSIDVIIANSITEFAKLEDLYAFIHFCNFLKINVVFAKERIDSSKKQDLCEILRYAKSI